MSTPGSVLRSLVSTSRESGRPLQILGAVNAYAALLAQHAGAKALYLSGSGVATASYGLPDLGITNLNDVCEDVRRITSVTSLPLLVDIDTGFGSAFGIARTIRELERAGAAGVHIEDQIVAKRCGHRPNKEIVSQAEMVDRIRAAVGARRDPTFVIMARTDALANEGMSAAIERSRAYLAAGADMLFPEALTNLNEYDELICALEGRSRSVSVPSDAKHPVHVIANITEFGKTPLFSVEDLGSKGVSMVLYPLSAQRAMAKAALSTYSHILRDGHQRNAVPNMQTREELYEVLNYYKYEEELDRFNPKAQGKSQN
jgi:methylisocitrate lyase